MNTGLIEGVLAKGLLAPSADNLQPWKFHLRGAHVDFFLDRARLDSFADTGLLMPYVSAGAVIENIRVASAEAGYALGVSYLPDPRDPFYVAALTFTLSPAAAGAAHAGVLGSRITNRRFYDRRAVPEESREALQRIAEEEGCRLPWLAHGDPAYQKLSCVLGKADQLRYEVERLHRELFKIIRFEKSPDGLPVSALEAGPGAGFMFRLLSAWPRMRFLNRLGMSRIFNRYTKLQMNSSGAAAMLCAPTQAPVDYIHGGEVMERVWHETALRGLALQPMEALPIFIVNLQQGEDRDFSPAQRQRLDTLKDEFFSLFGLDDRTGLILLFRIGYAGPPSVRSPRRPLESFLVNHENAAF